MFHVKHSLPAGRPNRGSRASHTGRELTRGLNGPVARLKDESGPVPLSARPMQGRAGTSVRSSSSKKADPSARERQATRRLFDQRPPDE
jgi:hypothetical protein